MARRRSGLSLAASFSPFGLFHRKPRHFLEMLRVAWRNRDNLRYAWRILTRGVCDGCALGTSGLRDWTIPGTHLCLVRLNLLRLNTMPAADPAAYADAAALRALDGRALRELGRLGWPLRRRRGERGFTRIGFDEAWAGIGARWKAADPDRTAMFVTSRGITNEVYYAAQKVMRFLGSNNIDNSARLCHSPSTVALKSAIGVAATTCSYTDWFDADLIVFLGSNPANDQPVAMKYLARARKRGVRVVSVNPYREPGLERYWVPSDLDSALFGTRMADRWIAVRPGGDLAFLNAVAREALLQGLARDDFIAEATTGFPEWRDALLAADPGVLVELAGVSAEDVRTFTAELARAGRTIFVWSMGITQHAHGSDTVRAIANLALLREAIGRPGTGLMPIRGHSGVQGGAEMGAYATAFPGGVPISPESAAHFSALWGFPVPDRAGATCVEALERAASGGLDALYAAGGNFLDTLPRPDLVEEALRRIPLRVHTDIVLSSQMLVEPAEEVYILPARTRYEQKDGGTETSTERRVIFSPEIPGHEVGCARSEWELLRDLAFAVRGEEARILGLDSGPRIREDIARAVPFYAGIERLSRAGDQFQWGGARLAEGRRFPTPDGRARFQVVHPPPPPPPGTFRLATRRGKQFNSMVQGDRDPLTGAARDHIFIAHADASRLGIAHGDPVLVESTEGRLRGRAFLAELRPGTLQAHWPEANVLIPQGRVDEGGVPDYNCDVTLRRG
jgi:molybdopterin-dependent oxidoreductase alpha subunit